MVTMLLADPAAAVRSGFLVNAFFGRRLPKSVSGGLACAVMIALFGVSVLSVWTMLGAEPRALRRGPVHLVVVGRPAGAVRACGWIRCRR